MKAILLAAAALNKTALEEQELCFAKGYQEINNDCSSKTTY
ncbi:hypothetical protein [Candidatus Paracaedibacter symbiosus]|nr:hypothetical protein [Candidatus Paracaedibacter symbiosus]